jgi:tetratricopeptide (TPR) repeat protein
MTVLHYVGSGAAASAIAVFGVWFAAPNDKALHEVKTEAAWKAFRSGKHDEAVAHADECIKEFRGAANRQQKAVDDSKRKIPNGRVANAQKQQIFNNGPLNDVATCYLVKARALDKLGRKDDSVKALDAAVKYPAARAWDAKGRWFWSPAQAAELFRTTPELIDSPPHEAYTTQAWQALENGDHARAADLAERCAKEFFDAAQEKEAALAQAGVELPTGAVDAAMKNRILENGVLNDVAAAQFIRGKAAEAKGDKSAALAAYADAVKLAHGRCWDAKGWFWSPAEAAADRIEYLRSPD